MRDPWTEPRGVGLRMGGGRGQGGGKWWCENGENCIQTSIENKKIKIKKLSLPI